MQAPPRIRRRVGSMWGRGGVQMRRKQEVQCKGVHGANEKDGERGEGD